MVSHAPRVASPLRGAAFTLSTITPPGSSEGGGGGLPPPLSESDHFARGTSIGRYVVVRHLGTGGQGVVYSVFDPELERTVALKLLRTDVGGGDADVRKTRMLREAQAHAQLHHPNVVSIFHVGTYLDQLYLAMDDMAGGTLTCWLASEPSQADVVARFLEAGKGLAAAHELGMVHRDFKPDNVLLDKRGVAHVADFGLAQRGDAAGGGGTTRYMAPEQQTRTESVGPAADQYAFCVALCEALTGRLPTVEGGVVKLPPAPAWLRPLLLRGLAQRPTDRFPSMNALLTALETAPGARRRLLSRAGFTLLLLGFVALITWLVTRETESERAQRECVTAVRARVEEMWNPAQQAAITAQFDAVSGQVGADVSSKAMKLLGPQVQAWGAVSERACLQPSSTAQVSCLESRARVLQSISQLFARADAQVVATAVNVVQAEVLPVASCLNPSVAGARVVPDSEADQRLRPTLAHVRVLKSAGRYGDALDDALAVAAQAHAERAPRVQAEAQLLVGQLSSLLRHPDTETRLTETVKLAEQASADEERARAWLLLITWYASRGDFESATRATEQADAILDRLGRPDLLEAAFQNQLGVRLMQQGDESAVEHFQRAIALLRAHYGKSHAFVLTAVTNYALAIPAKEGRPLLEKVLEQRAVTFGEDHPETANAAHYLGVVLTSLDPKAALVPLTRALEIWKRQKSPDTCRLAGEHFALARAHLALAEPKPTAEEQRLGINLILHAECPGIGDLGQEISWLRDHVAPAEHKQLDELLRRVRDKETLPDSLPPGRSDTALTQP